MTSPLYDFYRPQDHDVDEHFFYDFIASKRFHNDIPPTRPPALLVRVR